MTNQGVYDLRHDVDRLQNKVKIFQESFASNYFIECSVPAIFYKDETFTPKTLTFYVYKETQGKITTYEDGTMKLYSSTNGTDYDLIKVTQDSSSLVSMSDTSIKFYKCEVYNDDEELLDSQTVPILKDGKDGINGKAGADGRTPILHVRYANNPNPTSLSELKTYPTTEYRYQGVCWNYSDTAPTSISDYGQFVLFDAKDGVKGADGDSSYIHIAYANSEDGSLDFTNDIPDYDPIYIGIYIDENEDDPDDYTVYEWSLIQGTDGITVFLGNESQLIPCDSDGNVEAKITFTIPFYCYKGTSMYPCDFKIGSTNPFEQQEFTYSLDKQCTATDNGQITLTATKGSDLRGLKHSILTMNFEVDGEIISKQFNWAKVIKGADGKDGVDGEDGKTPNLYIRYSKTSNPSSLSSTITYESEGYRYQGIAWSTSDTAPTSISAYKPFVLYNPTDGVAGADGWVHIAYSSSADGSENFTTRIPTEVHTYMGVCTDHDEDDPLDYNLYVWSRFRGEDGLDGEDGLSITLGNESQLIPCDSDGAVLENTTFTIPFYCYKGSSLYPCNYIVGSTNVWTEQGFTYKLDQQCTAETNGQITLTAPKGSTLNNLKQCIITMSFLVDLETITKEFSWSKVIKGEDGQDGTDGIDGEDGIAITLGNESQLIPCDSDGTVLETTTFTIPFFCYKGTNLYPCKYDGGSTVWTNLGFNYTLNSQCTASSNGQITLIAYKGTTLNGFKQSIISMKFLVDTETIYKEFSWSKVIKGEDGEDGTDGATPTPSVIEEVISKTDVDANTLDGKTADSFMPSNIPVTYVCRNGTDTSANCVKLYELGQLIICQVWKFRDDGTNYGQDPDSSNYMLLMDKTIPARLCPAEPVYINDLNNDDGSSNGRLRISKAGRVTKWGTAGSSYNNSYGTFIWPVLPKQATTITGGTISGTQYGDTVSAYVESNGSGVANIQVLFTFTSTGTTEDTITKIGWTDNNGYVEVSMLLVPNVTYSVTAKCSGSGTYYESDTINIVNVSVSATKPTLTLSKSGKTITGYVKNSSGEVLPNLIVYILSNASAYTDKEGKFTMTVRNTGTYTVTVAGDVNNGTVEDTSQTITIT